MSEKSRIQLTTADEHVDSIELARRVRIHTLNMVHRARSSHVGTGLSMADILAVLYADILNVDPAFPPWHGRDRFILSKGHGAAAVYAVLAERGFYPVADLERYCVDFSAFAGHVSHRNVPGVEVSTGSLGHGLSLACGMALGLRTDTSRVFALLSDGELDEGSTWEAILFAGHRKLTNLVAVVDYNRIQSFGRVAEVLELEPLADKWRACAWHVVEIDGHDHVALRDALDRRQGGSGKPKAVIARTIKGKGVSFMEDRLEWHYRSPDEVQLAAALAEMCVKP